MLLADATAKTLSRTSSAQTAHAKPHVLPEDTPALHVANESASAIVRVASGSAQVVVVRYIRCLSQALKVVVATINCTHHARIRTTSFWFAARILRERASSQLNKRMRLVDSTSKTSAPRRTGLASVRAVDDSRRCLAGYGVNAELSEPWIMGAAAMLQQQPRIFFLLLAASC